MDSNAEQDVESPFLISLKAPFLAYIYSSLTGGGQLLWSMQERFSLGK